MGSSVRDLEDVEFYFAHEIEPSLGLPYLEEMYVHNAIVVLVKEIVNLKEEISDLRYELGRHDHG